MASTLPTIGRRVKLSNPTIRPLQNLEIRYQSTRQTPKPFLRPRSKWPPLLLASPSRRCVSLGRGSCMSSDGSTLVNRKTCLISCNNSPWGAAAKRAPVLAIRPLQQLRSNSSVQGGKQDETPALNPLKPTTLLRRLPHENIYTLPNILTFTRLLAAPAVGYFILTSQPLYALSLFFYAGVTDAVDGYLARRYNSTTVVGTVIDPMADKALMTIAVISLAVQGSIPVWLAVIILGRDVGLAISAIYFRWISLPPPKTMRRYWDFSLPSAEVHPTEISKINTLLQLLLVGNAMLLPVLPSALVDAWNLVGVVEGWQLLVAGTTVWSGLSYVWSKDAVKILTKEEIELKMEEMQEKNKTALEMGEGAKAKGVEK